MTVPGAIAEDLASMLAAEAETHQVPGATVGVLVGEEATTAAYGVTNAEYPAAVTAATMFQVGSITKTFASAAVMLLVEDGRLTLEDPVARFLPDLGAATGLDFEAITIERTLSHQSGYDGDHLFVEREGDDLALLADARRLFAPGAGFSYSNAGFSVAGAVVEAVSGQPFAAFVGERLLQPLGMTGAGFTADDVITYAVASPHWVHRDRAHVIRGAGWQLGWELGPVDRAAAGLIASVEHLLTWCRFQRTGTGPDGAVILTRASLDRLHTPVVNADRCEDIALDWFVRRVGGVTSIGHGGTTAGYVSDLLIVPERDFAFVSLTNATNGGLVSDSLRRWALDRCAGIDERDPEPDPTLEIDPTRFAGRFLQPFANLTVTPGDEPGTIVVTGARREDVHGWRPPVDPPITFGFFADDHAVSIDAPGAARVIRFGPDTAGRADWILWNSRRSPRLD